ncbi:MAG: YesL family protein [Acetivibrionales bacterium]
MAGFFGFMDYTKPGPGVPKDAPPKARIIVFFEIYLRKFWNLVKMNLLFNLFNIPAVIAMFFISGFYIRNIIANEPLVDLLSRFSVGTVFLCIPLITFGPAQAGLTYVMRNYAREEHAFLWSDFKEHGLKNFKQGLIISLIDCLVVLVMGIAMNFYTSIEGGGLLLSIPTGILIISFILFLMMHMYIYPMLVTFELTIKDIYKNAFIFSIIKFIPNLGILLLCAVLVFATFFFFPVVGMVLYLFITVSTISLLINFFVYPSLKKYIMDKIEEDCSQ